MNIRRALLAPLALFIVCAIGCGSANHPTPHAPPGTDSLQSSETSWHDDLKKTFRENYQGAFSQHQTELFRKYPVVVQDFLNMTLIRSGAPGERVRFQMQKEAYFTFAHTSHVPITTYSILKKENFAPRSQAARQRVEKYQKTLLKAADGVRSAAVTEAQKTRLSKILTLTRSYLERILDQGETSEREFKDYAKLIQPLVRETLVDGADQQLRQFKNQMDSWKKEFPHEDWSELRVVVLGFHQPRELYTLKQFFQWLLREPDFEHRVVYAEFQFPVFGQAREEAAQLALHLLARVDFDRSIGLTIFDDATILRRDVMGPAAVDILEEWGPSRWP